MLLTFHSHNTVPLERLCIKCLELDLIKIFLSIHQKLRFSSSSTAAWKTQSHNHIWYMIIYQIFTRTSSLVTPTCSSKHSHLQIINHFHNETVSIQDASVRSRDVPGTLSSVCLTTDLIPHPVALSFDVGEQKYQNIEIVCLSVWNWWPMHERVGQPFGCNAASAEPKRQ